MKIWLNEGPFASFKCSPIPEKRREEKCIQKKEEEGERNVYESKIDR